MGACRFIGRPVRIEYLPGLTAWRSRLLSSDAAQRGTPVHAGSFLRERRIVLDSALAGDELTRIQLHELFHFAWIRLSNARRGAWEAVIAEELTKRARGELGWSSEWRKAELSERPARFYREYLCESFCDTGAWVYAELDAHEEFTLAARWRSRRRAWFDAQFPDRVIPI